MLRLSTTFALTALLLSSLVSVGCQSNLWPGTVRWDIMPPGTYPNVVGTEGLNRYLRTSEPVVQRPEEGPMRVSVPVRYTGSGDEEAQYRFIFFDEDGAALSNQMGWRYVRLGPGTEQQLQGIAMTQDAADWRLEVRPTR